jgi:GNAT superfamily N-acetyltransferase
MPRDPPNASATQPTIRACRDDEGETIVRIMNAAAEAYRGVIPIDCWHEPYMPATELGSEIAAGVAFVGYEVAGALMAVMGIQSVRNVDLIRHAYVLPAYQGRGAGGALLAQLRAQTRRPILIGTWTAATWAIAFYERHGFERVPDAVRAVLLRTYWTVSPRQIETSVVLARPALTRESAEELVEGAGHAHRQRQ